MTIKDFQPSISLRPRTVLGFSPRRQADRSFPVRDGAGKLVATVATGTVTSKFLATEPDGQPLCAGQAQGPRWSAIDAAGDEIVTIKHVPFHDPVVLLCGGALRATLTGSAFKQYWVLTGSDETVLLQSEFTVAGHALAADTWTVRSNGELTTAEIIAVVHLHRLKDIRRGRVRFAADVLTLAEMA